MWCIVSSSKLSLQLPAIIATKAATISIAMGHLQDHLKAPSLNRLRLKKIIKWIRKTYFIDAYISAKTDPVMSALRASKIVEWSYFKIFFFFTVGQNPQMLDPTETHKDVKKSEYAIIIHSLRILKIVWAINNNLENCYPSWTVHQVKFM